MSCVDCVVQIDEGQGWADVGVLGIGVDCLVWIDVEERGCEVGEPSYGCGEYEEIDVGQLATSLVDCMTDNRG